MRPISYATMVVLVLVLALNGINCSIDTIAGGGSSDIPNGITVAAGNHTIHGKTRRGAEVSIFSQYYNPVPAEFHHDLTNGDTTSAGGDSSVAPGVPGISPDDSGLLDPPPHSDDREAAIDSSAHTGSLVQVYLTTFADSEGNYSFSGLPESYYNLLVRTADQRASLFIDTIPVFTAREFNQEFDSLFAPGDVSGVARDVSGNPDSAFVILLGSPFWTRSDSQGNYRLQSLAAGRYALVVMETIFGIQLEFSELDLNRITVYPDTTTVVP